MDANKISRDAMYTMGFQAAVSLSAEIKFIDECKRNGYSVDHFEEHMKNTHHFWDVVKQLQEQGLDPYWITRLMETHQRRI